MDRTELKRQLKEQAAEPLDRVVAAKLAYLQSDDVFETEIPQAGNNNTDDSLLQAFGASVHEPNIPAYKAPEMPQREPSLSARQVEEARQSVAEHKQNIAAKIAALRGISLPGDYLKNKR